ncbi:MAG: phosphotransferase [Desulfobacteraceae bacterium]|nr:phosphotransferase [Desulfobacteraceae bacterium]
MKALILAAGFGTRLHPYSKNHPKPLFTLKDRTVLDHTIDHLVSAGCTDIIINTHYLNSKIQAHVNGRDYPIAVRTRFEKTILGTGGAIRNLADFWDEQPVMVVNSDIVFGIDLRSAYQFHCRHESPVTLVLTDWAPANLVEIDGKGYISAIHKEARAVQSSSPWYTFTGIHIIDPAIISRIPSRVYADIIDTYRNLIDNNIKLKAYTVPNEYWRDIGTPERYRRAVIDHLAADVLRGSVSQKGPTAFSLHTLQGDGSDRNWYRVGHGSHSLILADHGIGEKPPRSEFDAFLAIGGHLYTKKVPVPRIHASDRFSGLVLLEDLGDQHLQRLVKTADTEAEYLDVYHMVIDDLIRMGMKGAVSFEPAWTWQSETYDKHLIMEKECLYFFEAFVNGYLGLGKSYDQYHDTFDHLADRLLSSPVAGFIHRDFQSRNIMIKDGRPCFIDFQGGRLGPIQYDMASLMIDPYADLSASTQKSLLDYYLKTLGTEHDIDAADAKRGYEYCTITRNLQILGAYGFLIQVKHKPQFEPYIPIAAKSLVRNLSELDDTRFIALTELSTEILSKVSA